MHKTDLRSLGWNGRNMSGTLGKPPVETEPLKGVAPDDAGIIQLPGLVPPLKDDTGECTFVLVFPRDHRAGGVVDHHETVEDPLEKAKKIFDVGDNPKSTVSLQKFQYIRDGEELEMELYQADIRMRFLDICSHSGIHVEQFHSLDRDEDFVTLTLPLQGSTIEYMAERVGYHMQLTREAYKSVRKHGPYPGEAPMKNYTGQEIFAYDKFTMDGKDRYQKFAKVDAIRLLEFWLDRWVSLDTMVDQGVLVSYYPVPDPEELEQIHRTILSGPRSLLPSQAQEGMMRIRRYFGDEIAFFFRFLQHLANATSILAIIGLGFYVAKSSVLGEVEVDYARTALAIFLSVWVAVMLQVFKRHTSRLKQYWGVKSNEEPIVQVNSDWDHERNGFSSMFVNGMAVLYVACYVGGILGVLVWQYNMDKSDFFYPYSSIILSVIIKGGNVLWSKLAPCLVQMENLRTERAYTDKLSALLSAVKIFVANWPFFAHAFLTNYMLRTCRSTFEEAAMVVYPSLDMAEATKTGFLQALKKDFSYEAGKQVCIPGCVPGSWQTDLNAMFNTTCDEDLESNLQTYFFILLAVEVVFLVLPIGLSYWEIMKEHRKVKDEEEGSHPYTMLQWEAKKFPYEFDSWGGDKVNDYLDSAISYSVIACWGSLCPVMFLFGCAQFFITYRLLVYRILYVTQRPRPRVAGGLGIWSDIFSCVNALAVATNVGLVCFYYFPGGTWPLWIQLAVFLCGEHVVLLLQFCVEFLIAETPRDVEEIGFYNDHVTSHFQNTKDHHKIVTPTTTHHINLSTNPENFSSDDESD